MSESFTAIDFETATPDPASICQIGFVRVEGGTVVKIIDLLVMPPKNRYHYRNVDVHGIRPEDTVESPTFDQIWPDIAYLIEDQVIVAHNVGFDTNCLRSTLAFYNVVQPFFEERCTRLIYKRGLSYLSKKYKIPLKHHHAASDAHACAMLYLKHLQRKALPRTGSLF